MIGRPSEPAGHLNRGAQYCGSPPNGQSEPCELGPPSEQHRTVYPLDLLYAHRFGTRSVLLDEVLDDVVMLPLHVGSSAITEIIPLSYSGGNVHEIRSGRWASGSGPAINVLPRSSWVKPVIIAKLAGSVPEMSASGNMNQVRAAILSEIAGIVPDVSVPNPMSCNSGNMRNSVDSTSGSRPGKIAVRCMFRAVSFVMFPHEGKEPLRRALSGTVNTLRSVKWRNSSGRVPDIEFRSIRSVFIAVILA